MDVEGLVLEYLKFVKMGDLLGAKNGVKSLKSVKIRIKTRAKTTQNDAQ
jgi:hypothetical protein